MGNSFSLCWAAQLRADTCTSEHQPKQEDSEQIKKMEAVKQQVEEVKRLWKNKRQLAHQALNLAVVVLTALMIWKALMMYTQSESPVVVVLSGSMEPAFQRGDILYLDNNVRSPLSCLSVYIQELLDMALTLCGCGHVLVRNPTWRSATSWSTRCAAARSRSCTACSSSIEGKDAFAACKVACLCAYLLW